MSALGNRDAARKRALATPVAPALSPLIDWRLAFRHDVFISYRRSESAAYAAWLYQRLSEADLSCFLDEHEAVAGNPLTPAIQSALDRARVLVVVLTGRVYESEWVLREIERFSRSGRPIVPIRVGDPMNRAAAMTTPLRVIFERDVLWIDEAATVSGDDAPSDPTVARVRGLFRFKRSRLLLRLSVVGIVVVLTGISVWAAVERFRAIDNQKLAESQELSVRSEFALPADPSRSLSLAMQAARTRATPQAETALRRSLRDSYLAAVVGGSSDPVHRATFSQSGKKLATLHKGWHAEIRDAANLDAVVRTGDVSTPDTAVVGMEFALHDTVLLTWDLKGRIEVWDTDTGQRLRTFGKNAFLADAAWMAPDRTQIASLADSKANGLIIWDIASGRPMGTVDGRGDTITAVSYSGDSTQLILATINPEATASSGFADGRAVLHVVEWATDRELVSWSAGQRRIGQIAVDATGDLIASAIGGIGPPTPTGSRVVADQPMLSLRGQNDDALKIWRREREAYRQVFSAESYQNPRIQVTADQRFVLFADENESRVISTRPVGPYQTLAGHKGSVTMLVTDPTGTLAATGSRDGSVRIWSIATGQALCDLRGHVGTVRSVALSADGRWAATVGEDGSARMWNMQCARSSVPLVPPLVDRSASTMDSRALSALVSGWVVRSSASDKVEWMSFDGTQSGRLSMPGTAVAIVGVSSAARSFGVVSAEGQLRIVDVAHLSAGTVGPAGSDFIFGAMSDNGRLFVRGDNRGQATVFDVVSGAPKVSMKRDVSLAPLANRDDPSMPSGFTPVRAEGSIYVAGVFDPSGQRLALSSLADVELWSAADGVLIGRLKGDGEPIRKMLFSSDGSRLLTLAYGRTRGSSEAPRLWSTANGRMIATLGGGQGIVASAAFTPDGQQLLTSSTNGHLQLWNSRDGALIREALLPADAKGVRAIDLTDTADFAALGGEDGQVFIVALQTLDVLLDLKLGARSVRDLRFARGTQVLAALLEDDSVVRYDCDLCAPYGKLIEQAEARLKVYRSARADQGAATVRATPKVGTPPTR